jgi:hypothetical protein
MAHLTGIPVRVERAARLGGNGSGMAREAIKGSSEKLPTV